MKKVLTTVLSLFLVVITIQAQSKEQKKKMKKELAETQYLATKDLINTGSYSFVALEAFPLGSSRIFLNTIPNYANIEGEQADIYLPYYGATRMANRYSAEAGIKFRGTVENYQMEFNDKKKTVRIYFEFQRDNERFEFTYDVFKDGFAHLVVTSGRRNTIQYNGLISELEMVLAK